jgi:hypothetical protein
MFVAFPGHQEGDEENESGNDVAEDRVADCSCGLKKNACHDLLISQTVSLLLLLVPAIMNPGEHEARKRKKVHQRHADYDRQARAHLSSPHL